MPTNLLAIPWTNKHKLMQMLYNHLSATTDQLWNCSANLKHQRIWPQMLHCMIWSENSYDTTSTLEIKKLIAYTA